MNKFKKSRSCAEYFVSRYIPEPNSGCWLWAGSVDRDGYAKSFFPGVRSDRASHMALILAGRPLTDGTVACHRCDTPACVNPDHLFEGTLRDNHYDAVAKGRNVRGDRHTSAKLCSADIPKIRAALADGRSANSIAREYGVTAGAICFIKSGRNWTHVN